MGEFRRMFWRGTTGRKLVQPYDPFLDAMHGVGQAARTPRMAAGKDHFIRVRVSHLLAGLIVLGLFTIFVLTALFYIVIGALANS